MVEKYKKPLREVNFVLESTNFRGMFGTIDINKPNVIYVKLGSWCNHIKQIEDYDSNVSEFIKVLKVRFKQRLKSTELFIDNIIFNIHFKKILIRKDDRFYTSFEFTLKQKNETLKSIEYLTPVILELCNDIISDMEKSETFKFFSGKK